MVTVCAGAIRRMKNTSQIGCNETPFLNCSRRDVAEHTGSEAGRVIRPSLALFITMSKSFIAGNRPIHL